MTAICIRPPFARGIGVPRATPHARAITPPMDAAGDTTQQLLHRIRAGDAHARERLLARYLPILRRWAHGRLPRNARDLVDTDDLVQVTLLRAANQLPRFEYAGGGCFLGYLRHVLLNALRNEIRRSAPRTGGESSGADVLVDEDGLTPLEAAVGRERVRRYEAALATLPRRSQELLVMRIEFGFDYDDIADETGLGRDAVRMAVKRPAASLARAMGAEAHGDGAH